MTDKDHGRTTGPATPAAADPATTGSAGAAAVPENPVPAAPAAEAPAPQGRSVIRSVAGTTWTGLIVGAVILILLLVFILQNGETVGLHLFIWEWNFPIGVGMLIAAVAGALIAACVGTVRIFQLRHQVKTGN